jgi:CelD/BcsL family acetyltransferase involved in cellulose biosynthesis
MKLLGGNRAGNSRIYHRRVGMNTTADRLDSPQLIRLHCEVISDFAELEKLSCHWQRLWEADPVAEIFQSFAWNRAWWRGYGKSLQLHCIVVWQGDVAVGFLPLVRSHQFLRFLGAPQADYGDILAEEPNTPAVLSAALDLLFQSGDWKECKLEHLSVRSRLVRNLDKTSLELRKSLRLVADGEAPTILVGERPGLLGDLAAKKHLRRHENKLAKSGNIRFRFFSTREEIRCHLPFFFQHQIRRRILHGQESSCVQPEFSCFLEALVEELDPARHLRFGLLEWEGRPLAYHIGFLAKGKFTMYQQAFDVDAWDYSPGEVLLRHLFLYAEENVSREFDFSVGEEPYKARFANHFKPNFTLYVEPRNLQGRIRHSYRGVNGRVRKFHKRLKAAVKSNPAAYQWAKQARRWTGEVRDRISNPLRPGGSENGLGHRPDAQLVKARLSDLADLYRESPNFRLSSRLAEYRERLRRGDTLFLMRMQGRPALIAWTTSQAQTTKPAVKIGSLVLYDYTFLQRRRKATYQTLVALLAAESTREAPLSNRNPAE